MQTLKELAKLKGYEIRPISQHLANNEKFELIVSPFEFSDANGGTIDSWQYYNNFYLYPIE